MLTDRIIEPREMDPDDCVFQVIDFDRRDELPPSIKCIRAEAFDTTALQEAAALMTGPVRVVQIETPVSAELRAFSQNLLTFPREGDSQSFTADPERGLISECFEKSLRDHLAKIPHLDPVLTSAWLDMQMASLRAAEAIYKQEELSAIFRYSTVNPNPGFHFHTHCSSFNKRSGVYLNLAEGEHGTLYPDERDCVMDGLAFSFAAEHPRIWVGKTFGARSMFNAFRTQHSVPVLSLGFQDTNRQMQTLEFCL